MLFRLLLFTSIILFSPIISWAQLETSEKVKFLALGDSYTIGQSVPVSHCWPVQLIDSLREKGVSCFDAQIIAATGWRTDNLSTAIQNANLSNTYTLVSLLIGVNNYYQGRTAESYAPEFAQLLDKAIALAGGNKNHVFVLSIPDYGYTPFGSSNQQTISAGINSFNAVNQQITQYKGVVYINITDISRRGLAEPDLVASDGLHPSGKMYTEWTQRILDQLNIQSVVTSTETKEDSSIKIYPNPTNTIMIIEDLPGTEQSFKIIFRSGNGVTAFQTGLISENRKASVDIRNLSAGTYFYELSGKTRVLKTGKLIKQ